MARVPVLRREPSAVADMCFELLGQYAGRPNAAVRTIVDTRPSQEGVSLRVDLPDEQITPSLC